MSWFFVEGNAKGCRRVHVRSWVTKPMILSPEAWSKSLPNTCRSGAFSARPLVGRLAAAASSAQATRAHVQPHSKGPTSIYWSFLREKFRSRPSGSIPTLPTSPDYNPASIHRSARASTTNPKPGWCANLGGKKVLPLHRRLAVSARHCRQRQARVALEPGLQSELVQDPPSPLQRQVVVQHLS